MLVPIVFAASALVLGAWAYLKMQVQPMDKVFLDGEDVFIHPKTKQATKFPSLSDKASVDLSLIVPSYNEQERLPIMLDETLQYLAERKKRQPSFSWEMIIVDDGSKDKTSEIGMKYAEKQGDDSIRVLTLKKNRGKGGAVKRGMMVSRGRILLMVDADGATKFSDLDRVEEKLRQTEKNEMGIVVGSRAHLQDSAVAKRSFIRNLLMHAFHLIVYVLCVKGIKDTQCGFKLFSRSAAQKLFPNQHIERWAFDVELLYLAEHFGIPACEVAVNWTEIDGSKLSPFEASVQMAKDLLRIRANYMFGIWTVKSKL